MNKETLKELYDLFAKERPKIDGYMADDENLYSRLYRELEEYKALDYNYLDNFEKIKGEGLLDKMKHVDALTFKECCTMLTWILRSERFCEGSFYGEVNNGNVLKLLKRAYETVK